MAFKLGDVHLPDVAEVLARMTEDTELQGTVSLLSDQGQHRAAFAVVEVKGILMPLIVPAACMRRTDSAADAGERIAAADEKDWRVSLEQPRS